MFKRVFNMEAIIPVLMWLRGCSWNMHIVTLGTKWRWVTTRDEVWNTCWMLSCVHRVSVARPCAVTCVSWDDMWCHTFTGVSLIESRLMTHVSFVFKVCVCVFGNYSVLKYKVLVSPWASGSNCFCHALTIRTRFLRMGGTATLCVSLLKP